MIIKELFDFNNYYFNPYAVPLLIVSVLIILLGAFVISKDWRHKSNRIFFLLCLSIGWWLGIFFFAYNAKPAKVAEILIKIGFTGVIFLLVFSMHFVMLLITKKTSRLVFLTYGLGVVSTILLFVTPYILNGVTKYFWGYYTNAGRLFPLFLLWYMSTVASLFFIMGYTLFFKRDKLTMLQIKQLKYFFIGVSIFTLAAADFIANFGIEIYPFGYLTTFLYTSIIGFTIIRFRFLEIDTVLHRTLLWLASVLLLVLPLGLAFSLNLNWLVSLKPFLRTTLLSFSLFIFLAYFQHFKPKLDHFFRRRKYDYQKALLEIPSKIGTELELGLLVAKLFKELKETLYIQNSLLLVRPPDQEDYQEAGASGYDKLQEKGLLKEKPAALGKDSLLIQHLTNSQGALEKDLLEADPQYQSIKEQAKAFFIQNHLELLVPLFLKSELKGLLCLGKKENLKPYTLKDIQLLEQLGSNLGLTLDNALHHQDIVEKERLSEELRLGREIQTGLLPKEVPDIEGLKIAGLMEPAKEIGGDYYDYLPKAKDKIAIVIGDVSGKGVGAGLLMAVAKTAIYTISSYTKDPKAILISTNDILYQYMQGEKFMTLLYLEYSNPEKKIIYSSAGHEYILHYRSQENRCIPIKSGGFMLGMLPEVADMLEQRELLLNPGDKLILYTDGVTEAENQEKERFTLSRLIKNIEKHSQKSVSELLNSLYAEVKTFIGNHPQYDDITLITLEVL